MNTYLLRLKQILPPFTGVAFATVIILGLLRWFFDLKYSLVDIREELWEFWLPIVVPVITTTIWLRKPFKQLTIITHNYRSNFFYHLISWATMVAMLLFSQAYLTTATGSLRELSTIKGIEHTETSRYYKLAKFSVVPYYGGTYSQVRKSGRFGETLSFAIYFVIPITADSLDKLPHIPITWYGVKFTKQINNWTSSAEKQKRYRVFYEECLAKMNKYNFKALDHFERLHSSNDKDNFLNAIQARVKQPTIKNFIVLKGVKEKYEDRNGNKLAWVFGSFGIGLCVLLLSLIHPNSNKINK